MRKVKTGLLLFILGFQTCVFGQVWSGWCLKTPIRLHDLSQQGSFFATTDFDFDPSKPDTYLNYWSRPLLTRGQTTGKIPTDKRPWLSENKRTLFGITFDNNLLKKWKYIQVVQQVKLYYKNLIVILEKRKWRKINKIMYAKFLFINRSPLKNLFLILLILFLL